MNQKFSGLNLFATLKQLLIAGILLAPACAVAQQSQLDTAKLLPARYQLLNLYANWLQTNNAAGMQVDSLKSLGRTSLGFSNLKGSLKMAQQPDQSQQLSFQSERYLPLGKALFYGNFSYTQQWDKNIRLSDVLDPYRGTPYLLADSIGGNWRKQLYALQLKAATPTLFNNKVILGLGANLNVGTGARQNDPRPLSTNNEISLTPAIIWNLNQKNHIGFNGLYAHYREEISLEVKNTYVNHYLYKFLGLGEYELPTIFSVGASRTYDGNRLGGDVQYEYRSGNFSWLTTAGYHTYTEKVLDGSSIPRKSGTWQQKVYNAATVLKFTRGSLLHHISLNVERTEDTGVEFHEYYNTTTKTWQTILEAPFYLAQTDQAGFTYTLVKKAPAQLYSWLVQAGVNYLSMSKNYLVPASAQQIERADFWVKFGKNWSFNKSASLQASLQALYSANIDQGLSFVPITADRTLVAREILLPDQAYLSANRSMATANVQYNFGFRQVANTRFFVGATANYLRNNGPTKTYLNATGNRTLISINLGAFY